MLKGRVALALALVTPGALLLATCEAAHESLDEENLDLEISCRVSKAADAALLVVRNHGGDAATLDAGRALVVLRRYAA